MCTLTWSHRPSGGLALCFNRDEKHERPTGLPPVVWEEGGFLAPQDGPRGGTWLAVLRDGRVLALLNHYPANFTPASQGPSRGGVIPALAAGAGQPDLATLRQHIRPGMNPFRLLLLAPGDHAPLMFTWDGDSLTCQHPAPRTTGMFTSSSWNTHSVVAARHAAFRAWKEKHPRPALEDLSAFHCRMRHPLGTAWAVCMSRKDARTVSLNTVCLHHGRVVMTHRARPRGEPGFDPDTHRVEMCLTAAR